MTHDDNLPPRERTLIASLTALRGRPLQEVELDIVGSGLDWFGYWPEVDRDGEITGRITNGSDGGAWRGVSVRYGQIVPDDMNATAMQIV